ncbi:MAG: radical SAM protein [Desulfobacteraceae bacterium]|nr:radical SAM protein [Desulfobacteraceae bacterium]
MNPAASHDKPFIVPVFIPHAGCPQRCIFCNQHSTTGQRQSLPSLKNVQKTIHDFLAHRRDSGRRTEISFYGGSFLGLPTGLIQLLLATATHFVRQGLAHGIRFSTRPDTIDSARLALLDKFPVTTVEIGVQSMSDPVLERCLRGHNVQDTLRALALLKSRSYSIGVQVMLGLPGDSPTAAKATARQLAGLGPHFARIYPTVVLRGSALAQLYAKGQYEPLALDEAVALAAEVHQIFALNDIPVIRMGLQDADELSPDADLVAGPHHPAFGELVYSKLWQDAICKHIEKEGLLRSDVMLAFHPHLQSQIKGPKDANIFEILQRCALSSLEIQTNETIEMDRVTINGQECRR